MPRIFDIILPFGVATINTSGKRVKSKGAINLPRFIHDELRMTCALKGYSSLKTGKSRRLPDQYLYMEKFYHGKVPSHPAQIQLLAKGHLNYRDMYDVVSVKVTKKRIPNLTHPLPPNLS